jgi:misacylated tRNA(Ala) deacylase
MTTMKPNKGRLQTAEHILARTVEHKIPNTRFIISKFEENIGKMEISAETDLRKINRAMLQDEVNAIIQKNLQVNKYIIERKEAEAKFDLTRLPSSVKEIRIVEIEGFDKTPCKDPHVENTREIGYFEILKVERTGKDRYRFIFKVK